MKICLIGAGRVVFGPTVLHDAIVEHRLDGRIWRWWIRGWKWLS